MADTGDTGNQQGGQQPGGAGPAVDFDPSAEHHIRPKLRPVRPMPINHEGKQVLGLRDAQMISEQMVVTGPLAQFLLGHMDGQTDLQGIIAKGKQQAQQQNVPAQAVEQLTEQPLKTLIGQLDAAGMLEGPRFDSLLEDLRQQFDSTDILPPSATAEMADALAKQDLGEGFDSASDEVKQEAGSRKLAEALDQMIEKGLENAEDPSWDALPRAVFVPQMDYQRGWLNYAAVYGRMRVCDKPDRVVVIGSNNFGRGKGVVGCDKGFGSPLGDLQLDDAFLETLKSSLGPDDAKKLMAEKYDHEREAAIEMQVPWLRHVFADRETGDAPKIAAFLVHDYLRNNGEPYDDTGLGAQPFIDALRQAIEQSPGKTLVIGAAELAHVGPAFGDQVRLVQGDQQADEFRKRVVEQDRNLLQTFGEGKVDEMTNQLAWSQNANRWSSVGPMVVTLDAVGRGEVKLLNYMGASDQQGMTMTTSFAGVVH